ncbi:MAG: hypothetical protein SWQ30_09545 [Thermodesulfobacteriota bacterium]|nr:hypothetical protein [Thermodesulfobacteriota bacterium]
MDIFFEAEIAVPMSQIALLLTLNSVFLLFRRIELGLLTNYIFALYWGYLYAHDHLLRLVGNRESFLMIYFGIGVGILGVALLVFLFKKE